MLEAHSAGLVRGSGLEGRAQPIRALRTSEWPPGGRV